MPDLVIARPEGLYCPAGDFHIDPWRPVARAVITHAHGDHARPGSARYLGTRAGEKVLRTRLGDIALDTLDYGEALTLGEARVSLHPAGHVLGSAQVRIEVGGEVCVVSGDYKTERDPTCLPFEPVRCDTFVTESTFGLPVYRWDDPDVTFADMAQWWRGNADSGRVSMVYAYAFGKAQRILAGLAALGAADIGPLVCHGAVEVLNEAYRASGVALPPTARVDDVAPAALRRALVIAPPSAAGTPWLRRFGDFSDAFASGWMRLRGARRRRALDRGFVLSDHADWPGLQSAIDATGASRVIVTHGNVPVMVRWLEERGIEAASFATEYDEDAAEAGGAADPGGAANTGSAVDTGSAVVLPDPAAEP